jgi:hypothetical protein
MTRTILICLLAACGGGDDAPAIDAPAALTCKSIALCSTYDVKTFIGTIDPPAGGAIHDGIYRLAWIMDPSSTGDSPGYHDGLDALQIRGTSYNWAGFFRDHIGSISASGTAITFQKSQHCERGSDGSSTTDKLDYKYTASATELRLYSHVTRSDGTEWDRLYVYVLTSAADEVCRTVSTEPTSPGDSADCTVTNCACRFAIEGTVSTCT